MATTDPVVSKELPSADEKAMDPSKLEFAPKGVDTDDSSDEQLHTVDHGFDASSVIISLPAEEEKRILRKIDYRLVPVLSILYLVAFVDRSNIGV